MIRTRVLYDENVLSWSKRLLSLPGLWPENPSDVRFFLYITYVEVFASLELVTFAQNTHDTEKTLRNITLSLPTVLIVLKAVMFRVKMHLLMPILSLVKNDVAQGLFQNAEEQQRVVSYNVIATLFTTSSVLSLFFVPTLFYTKPIVECFFSRSNDCTLPYELPSNVKHVYEVTEVRLYALFCICLAPASTLLTVGATGADSLLVSLTFHLCGQLSILRNRLKSVDLEPRRYHYEMRILVQRHTELLRLATILGDTFSSLMFVQTMGLIFSLCVVAYQLLMITGDGQDVNTIHFVIYSCAVVFLAFCYCFLGECLIHESSAVDLACYFSNWQRLPPEHARPIMLCIARSRKPPCLTAGKFYVFSLETFGIIMKASMAYLSVLKNIT